MTKLPNVSLKRTRRSKKVQNIIKNTIKVNFSVRKKVWHNNSLERGILI